MSSMKKQPVVLNADINVKTQVRRIAEPTEPVGVDLQTGDTAVFVAENAPLKGAIESLQAVTEMLEKKRVSEEQVIALRHVIERATPPEALVATITAMRNKWGKLTGLDNAEHHIEVQLSPTERVTLPWGKFVMDHLDKGFIGTVTQRDNSGMYRVAIVAELKRKFQGEFDDLVKRIEAELAKGSIYKGKALRIHFRDEDGDYLTWLEPQFISTINLSRDQLILSHHVQTALNAGVFTRIEHREACMNAGVPLKCGVLLCGPYGTGKTLTANVTAKLCEQHGWTFLYLENVRELADALRFAEERSPAVIFAEDSDQVFDGERDQEMNEILNLIDGVEGRDRQVMVVLTTNHHEKINPAMKRPGRIDEVIVFSAPDAEASVRLVKLYAKNMLPSTEDLTEVGRVLAGMIPAQIREVVERSKLFALAETNGESASLSASALLDAAQAVREEHEFVNGKTETITINERFSRDLYHVVRGNGDCRAN